MTKNVKNTPSVQYILVSLWKGNSLARAYFNWETRKHTLRGKVLDVGAGRTTDYHEMQREKGVTIEKIDQKLRGIAGSVNLEKDQLPYETGCFHMVLMYNLLEHIFNYKHVVKESFRTLENKGKLFGFVPFLVRYHPDPHDYFRYTGEALQQILEEAGYKDVVVKPLGEAMFSVQFHSMSQSLPSFLSVIFYPFYRLADWLYLHLRPHTTGWYPLGYFFTAKKDA